MPLATRAPAPPPLAFVLPSRSDSKSDWDGGLPPLPPIPSFPRISLNFDRPMTPLATFTPITSSTMTSSYDVAPSIPSNSQHTHVAAVQRLLLLTQRATLATLALLRHVPFGSRHAPLAYMPDIPTHASHSSFSRPYARSARDIPPKLGCVGQGGSLGQKQPARTQRFVFVVVQERVFVKPAVHAPQKPAARPRTGHFRSKATTPSASRAGLGNSRDAAHAAIRSESSVDDLDWLERFHKVKTSPINRRGRRGGSWNGRWMLDGLLPMLPVPVRPRIRLHVGDKGHAESTVLPFH